MTTNPRRAVVIGAGLIGGSIGLGLRDRGWHVSGVDLDPAAEADGMARGCFDDLGLDPAAQLVFVAVPAGAIVAAAREALAACPDAVVTDVGGVKAAIVAAIDDPRFVGGHPMAGSERLGIAGADEELFQGAAWVLAPGPHTDDRSYAAVRAAASQLGAEVLTLSAPQHDSLVAVVSHVPHLTAASLVRLARERADDHRAVLRLAAGGFRDMTRVAAGSPTIWPDICTENREAIVATLDSLVDELTHFRDLVSTGDRAGLLRSLEDAQEVRRSLPTRGVEPAEMREVRVAVADRPGEVAAVATLATELGVNLYSLQTVDAAERPGGTLHVLVAAADADRLVDALRAHDHPAVRSDDEGNDG